MKKNIYAVFLITVILLLLGGCSSLSWLVERGGRVLDGAAFKEKVLGVYREEPRRGVQVSRRQVRKGGEEIITIISDWMPNLSFRASMPAFSDIVDLSTGGRFELNSLYFLSPNLTGWNEFTLELSGSGNLTVTGTGATLHLDMPVEKIAITEGKIRRDNNRINGEQAITALHNRQERISVLTEWMHAQNPPADFKDQTEFETYWKPIVLPELVSAKKRPPDWPGENAAWIFADDIRWNTTYTQARFPEELHKVRDSGTLLRDWEEALSWIYFDYEWDRLIASLNKDITLIKIK
ncbi:hypothetical protein AGMMS49579_06400 [Spirochaetia bacterium]|nr:hypothetical protein AGMMS49579_06400 [Spirochaetia bacterium]